MPRRPLSPRPPPHPPNRREAHRPSGWDRYLSVLERHRVPENQRQWYMRRAEAFIDAVKPMRMGEVAAEQITAFFLGHAREQRLSDWQFRQMVDAVQLLLIELTDSAGARELDWDYWKEAGRELQSTGRHRCQAFVVRYCTCHASQSAANTGGLQRLLGLPRNCAGS